MIPNSHRNETKDGGKPQTIGDDRTAASMACVDRAMDDLIQRRTADVHATLVDAGVLNAEGTAAAYPRGEHPSDFQDERRTQQYVRQGNL